MEAYNHASMHSRIYGLMRQIDYELEVTGTSDGEMSQRERRDLAYIVSVLASILKDDETTGKMSIRKSDRDLNTQCEFFDMDANRIQCAAGCNMYHCSRKCAKATNVPGSEPPYGTKYMKGRIGK